MIMAIEWFIGLHTGLVMDVKLQMADTISNDANALIVEIDDIIFYMGDSSFYPYFRHVGFP
jgi:hypothetical protein